MDKLAAARAAALNAAHKPLADLNLDNDLAQKAATAVVDALLTARSDRGLAYLRGMSTRQRAILRLMHDTTGSDFTLFFGNLPMGRAVEAAAVELVKAFGRGPKAR